MYVFTSISTVRVCIVLIFSLCYGPICLAQFSLAPYIGDVNRSRAGGAAVAEDATTVFTNPAGLSKLSGQQWVFESKTYISSSKFENQGSVDLLGNPTSGENGGDGGATTFVPGIYYSNNLTKNWTFGLGINTPFGLSTNYDRSWVGRYTAVMSGIKTLNINPSFGLQVNQSWSVGMGVSVQNAEAELSSAIDFGAVCLAALDPTTCATLGMPSPQSADGFAQIKGDDWSTGYNFGILWAHDKSSIGVSYRSKIDHTLKGNVDFTIPAQAAVFNPVFTDTNVETPITLPEIISMSIYHNWTTRFAIMADITFTRWSRIKQFEFDFENPAQPDQTIAKEWQDTTRYALGFDYNISPTWDAQWGIAYEQSAIPDKTYDPSIPVSDAIWLNAGTKFYYSKNLSIDFGLVHIIFQERDVNISGQFGETFTGKTSTELDIINAQINWNY